MTKLDLKSQGYEFKIGDGFHHKEGTEYIVDVFDRDGNECAYFKFNHWINHPIHGEIIHVMEAEVFLKHRRRGIATYAYNLIEEMLNLKIHHEPDQQSDSAKEFWKNRLK